MFKLNLRLDDSECLQHAKALTGLGNLCVVQYDGDGQHSQMAWQIRNRHECRALCDLLDPYGPGHLRSKKGRDFEIWAQAVEAWIARDFQLLGELDLRLRAVRVYTEPVD